MVYREKSTGNFSIRATKLNENDKFVTKHIRDGKAKSKNISDAELGRCIRKVLANCD